MGCRYAFQPAVSPGQGTPFSLLMSQNANRRRFVATLLVIVITLPWLAQATEQSITSMFNLPAAWVPTTLEYRRNYDWFRRVFETYDTVVFSFEGCSIDEPRLGDFSRALFSSDDDGQQEQRPRYFQDVINGYDLLAQLQQEEVDLSERAALARLKGTFLGPDGKTTCVLVTMTKEGAQHRQKSLAVIRQTALDVFQLTADQLLFAGSMVDGATIDEVSIASINDARVPSMVLACLLCLWCLRSLMFTGVIFFIALFGQALVLSLVVFTGEPLNAILTVMPGLVFVLSISAGVHLSRYYHNASSDPDADRKSITTRAIRYGAVPCVLATFTTVIGLLSLSVSQMIPIRNFSVLSSVAVSTTTVLLFAMLPFVMDKKTQWTRDDTPSKRHGPGRFSTWWARQLNRYSGWIVAVFFVMLATLAFGAAALTSSVDLRHLFRKDSRILQDYNWLEENLGGQVTAEVVLAFSGDQQPPPLAQLELVRDAQVQIHLMDEVGGTLSAATFFPTIPRKGGVRRTALRSVYAKRMPEALERFRNGKLYTEDGDQKIWRISARMSALHDTDYGEFLNSLRQRVDPLVNERAGESVETIYTGALPVSYQAQTALLDDLFRSYLTAFVLVAVVMVVVLRSLAAGLLVMLPNLFPTMLLFGLMGWLEFPVDIGSVMTASVALGIAVDDTLHFLLWYRREVSSGSSRLLAVRSSLSHCGPAMIHTSLIVSVGLLAYLQSGFAPTQRFAQMMMVLLAAALLGDLILLPALLLGRFGKVFQTGERSNGEH